MDNTSSEENSNDTSIITEKSTTAEVGRVEVDGEVREFTLQNTFDTCPIIDALNTSFTTTQAYSFLDIDDSPYKNSIQQFRNLNLVHGTIN